MSTTEEFEIPLEVGLLAISRPFSSVHKVLISENSIRYTISLLDFHKTKDVENLNKLIRQKGDLFSEPDDEEESRLIDELYVQNHTPRERRRILKLIEENKRRKVIYSSPILLAAVYRVVKTYPELIHKIENAVFVQRAINYMEGSYINQLGRAFAKISFTRGVVAEKFNTKACNLLVSVLRTILVVLTQYGITGNTEYLDFLQTIPLLNSYPYHQMIMALDPKDTLGVIDIFHKEYTRKIREKLGPEYITARKSDILRMQMSDITSCGCDRKF
jgi:hypothetical protein